MNEAATVAIGGVVRGNVITLEDQHDLPEGALVEVRPTAPRRGSPQAVLEAVKGHPRVSREDVDELMRLIEEGSQPAEFVDPFGGRQDAEPK